MRLIVCLVCLTLVACSKSDPNGSPAPISGAPVSGAPASGAPATEAPGSVAAPSTQAPAPASEVPPAVARAPDSGPVLKRSTTPRPAEERAEIKGQADGRQVVGGATFVRIAMPDLAGLLPDLAADARLMVEADGAYGLAVPAADGRQADRALAYVRFAGAVPARFTLVWHQPAPAAAAGSRQRIVVEGADKAPENELVVESFWRAAASWFERRGSHGFGRMEPFYAFAAARLQLLGEAVRPGGNPTLMAQTRRGDVFEAMALYTGWTSVEETLQADRGLRVATQTNEKPSLPLAGVKGIDLPGHPWDELLSKVPAPAIEPLAEYAPADMLYLHFHDLRDLVKLASDADELLTPVMRTLEEQAGDRHFSERYEHQLMVQRSALSRTFGHLAVQGVALLASDPFFREGTDVSILFHIRNAQALEQSLGTYEAAARQRRPDVTETQVTVGDQSVRFMSTADGDIHQYRLQLNDVLILSNSETAITHIIQARQGQLPNLKSSGDFKYFRAIYPFSTEAEDGFLFIGDDFVRNAISPRVKILQSRRMAARAAIQAAGFSALLYGWIEGRRPADVAELTRSGLLAAADLVDGDGQPIVLDLAKGASSARWGNAAGLTPTLDLPLTTVSEVERDAYDRFRDTYQTYWRGFIDPIGVRIDRDAQGGLSLDARILPLIEQSEYNEIARTVGDTRISVEPLDEGFRFMMAVAPESKLRSEIDTLGRQIIARRDVGLSWLGDWVMVGFEDRSTIWDLALSTGMIPMSDDPQTIFDRDARRNALGHTPIYVGADISDGLALAATLTGLKAFAETAAPGLVDWRSDTEYRGQPVVKIQEKMDGDGISIYYTIVNKTLLMSMDRPTLEARINATLDGKRPKVVRAPKEDTQQGQAILAFAPRMDGWLGRTILGMLEGGAMSANRTAARAFEALARGLPDLPAGDAERQALALAWLGQEPINVHGGRFDLGPDGLVTHPLYGTETEPKLPDVPVAASPAAAFLAGLAGLQLTLGYEGGTLDRGLHTTVRWTRRP